MSKGGEDEPQAVRLDKWLWAARFYKTRALSVDAIRKSQVTVNEQKPKPARMIRMGDLLHIERAGERFEVEVTGLSEQRRSASEAARLYSESDASRAAREEASAQRRAEWHARPRPPEHRPDKRERRRLLRLLKNS